MRIEKILIHNFRSIIHQEIVLCDYTLLIGSNNSGKSTVIDAIRAFYEKDKYAYQDASDFPIKGSSDDESWIEISYLLTDAEYLGLAEVYRLDGNRLKVRKYFKTRSQLSDGKSAKGAIVGYNRDGTLSKDHFYGAQNVQKGKLGTIIYIPATSSVDEYTKLTGPSALRDLITNIMSSVIEGSATYARFSKSVDSFSEDIKDEQTPDQKSLTGFESELNAMLSEWGTSFGITFRVPSSGELIKNMIQWSLFDRVLENTQSVDQFGSGFQRHFIYSLIRIANEYMPSNAKIKIKDFSPRMNLLLFEEPEAFLHPPQQQRLCSDLIQLGKKDDWQVIATTHSSHFVSRSSDMLTSLVHLVKRDNMAAMYQIMQVEWEEIVDSNKSIICILSKHPKYEKALLQEASGISAEAIRYFMWLNAERANAFFATHTILVEGPSEVALINKLIDDGKISSGVYVFDCMGKFNVHRFMNLFGVLGINHSVIIDDDVNKSGDELEMQNEVNSLIADSVNPFTRNIEKIPGNIEMLLDVTPSRNSSTKPLELIMQYESGTIDSTRIAQFVEIVHHCLG